MTTVHDTFTESVLPKMRTGLVTAREKGGELMTSDAATEAKRRGYAMIRAARGDAVVVKPARRWGVAFGFLSLGAALGVGLTWLARRMSAPVETYRTGPLPTTTPATRDTATEDVDLRAGAPTRT